jgi:transposase
MSDSIFVGIDVSTKSNKVCILDQQGNRLAKMSVDNNSDGSRRIVNRVVEALTKLNCYNVSFGLEATSVYGDGLIFFLKQEPSLKPYNTKVYLLNPKQVHNFKKAYSELPKTDDVDGSYTKHSDIHKRYWSCLFCRYPLGNWQYQQI